MSKEQKDRVEHFIRQNNRLVKGVFRNHYTPGAAIKIPHRISKGPITTYHLKDGQKAEIPMSLAKHLNNQCYEPCHELSSDPNEQNKIRGPQRYSFESLDFLTDDLEQPVHAV